MTLHNDLIFYIYLNVKFSAINWYGNNLNPCLPSGLFNLKLLDGFI